MRIISKLSHKDCSAQYHYFPCAFGTLFNTYTSVLFPSVLLPLIFSTTIICCTLYYSLQFQPIRIISDIKASFKPPQMKLNFTKFIVLSYFLSSHFNSCKHTVYPFCPDASFEPDNIIDD